MKAIKSPGYKRIQFHERHTIMVLYRSGVSIYSIAKQLHRSYSSVHEEVKKGMCKQRDELYRYKEVYDASYAQLVTDQRKILRGPDVKIGSDHKTADALTRLIKMGYSPYAAIERLRSSNELKTSLCPRTVYNYIYQGILDLTTDDLIYKRRKKRKKKTEFKDRKDRIARDPNFVSISKRPIDILNRVEFGHWEGDTVVAGLNKEGAILTLIERSSRYLIAELLPDKKSSSVVKALDKIEKRIGINTFRKVFKSVCFDNGSEFFDTEGLMRSISKQHGHQNRLEHIYFAHPYCSSERGSNENIHRFLRRKWPKGSGLSSVNEREFKRYIEWINDYPRKLLGGKSAASQFFLNVDLATF